MTWSGPGASPVLIAQLQSMILHRRQLTVRSLVASLSTRGFLAKIMETVDTFMLMIPASPTTMVSFHTSRLPFLLNRFPISPLVAAMKMKD